MKTDIILAGVGGQGILSIATVIGMAALKNNLHVKQAETHGMSQRGGAVVSHLRLSDTPIYSDLIPKGEADIILSVEPMESLRYLPFLSDTGYIITNTAPFLNISNYPELKDVILKLEEHERTITFNADEIAKYIGSKLVSNMVVLGAASPFLNHISFNNIEEGIKELFSKKGSEIVDANLKAIMEGKEISQKFISA